MRVGNKGQALLRSYVLNDVSKGLFVGDACRCTQRKAVPVPAADLLTDRYQQGTVPTVPTLGLCLQSVVVGEEEEVQSRGLGSGHDF